MQTKTESLVEQITATTIKFCWAWLTYKMVIVPLIESGHLALGDGFAVTVIFTVNSLILGYGIRRAFNGRA